MRPASPSSIVLLAAGEADAGGVHHREVARHRIVQPDEAVIEDLNRLFRHALLHSAHVASTLTRAQEDADTGS